MRSQTTTHLYYCRILCLALLGAVLTGITAVAGAQAPGGPMPGQYEDDGDHTPASKVCKGLFDGVGVPKLGHANKHRYVLLLVFTDAASSDAAGMHIFHADHRGPNDPPRGTVGCIKDPLLKYNARAGGLGWGLRVQGDCPTDCTSPKMEGLITRGHHPGIEEDPLKATPNLNWGIFSVHHYEATNIKVRVWQIRVADAVHAENVLNQLETSEDYPLSKQGGYLGHLMIGYWPHKR